MGPLGRIFADCHGDLIRLSAEARRLTFLAHSISSGFSTTVPRELKRFAAALGLMLVSCFALPAFAQQGDEFPSIATATENFERKEGFFTIYRNLSTGEALMEVDASKLGKEFISFSYTENGVPFVNHFRGSYRDNRILTLKRNFKTLQLINKNTRYFFDPEKAISRAADANISDAVLAALPIVAADLKTDNPKYLVKIDFLLLTDALYPVGGTSARAGMGGIAQDRTSYKEIRTYPNNVDFIVDYVFSNRSPRGSAENIADPRAITVTMQHSFIAMPEDGYEPRLDDYRVGYFTERVTDLTSESAAPYRDMISRWRLEKKDPDAPLSDPVKPIVWWIENTTPVEYRETIRKAALSWNTAFERAGFTNAIQVDIQPDDAEWDAGDIRYNVIRWTSSPSPLFGGYGPSFTNPRTGEILGADVMLELEFITNRNVIDAVFGSDNPAAYDPFAAYGHTIIPNETRTIASDDASRRIVNASANADDKKGWRQFASALLGKGTVGKVTNNRPAPDDSADNQVDPTNDGNGSKLDNLGSTPVDPSPPSPFSITYRTGFRGASPYPGTSAFKNSADVNTQESFTTPISPWQQRHSRLCSASQFLSTQIAFGRFALAAFEDGTPDDAKAYSDLIEQSLYYLVLHELGHTLGLSHNMKSSTLHGPREVHDPSVTQGIVSGSVMEYPAINIAPPGIPQGDYTNTKPGPYDDWAIEFGYQPPLSNPDSDKRRREAILSRASRPELAFGNDADDMRFPGSGIDPRIMIGDMSSDPVAYAADRFMAIDQALSSIVRRYDDNESWAELRRQYAAAYSQRRTMAGIMARQIGGVYVERRPPDQYKAFTPYTPVPEERQRQAVRALAMHVFAKDALQVPTELAARLQPQRRGFDFFGRGEDPKIHDQVLGIQAWAMAHLLHPATLQRLTDTAAYGNTYSVMEFLKDMNDTVFGTDLQGRPNSFRQNLQIQYILRLRFILLVPFYDTVAKSAALAAIDDIRVRMGTLDFWLSAETRAHRKHISLLIAGI